MQEWPANADGSAARGCVQSPECVACMISAGSISATGKPSWSPANCSENCYPDGLVATNAIEQLEYAALHPSEAQPFFIAVGMKRPHLGWFAPANFFDEYTNSTVRSSVYCTRGGNASYHSVTLDNSMPCMSMVLQIDPFPLAKNRTPPVGMPSIAFGENGEISGMDDVKPLVYKDALGFPLVPDWKHHELRRAYYAATSFMDSQIGRVCRTITLGQDEYLAIQSFGA